MYFVKLSLGDQRNENAFRVDENFQVIINPDFNKIHSKLKLFIRLDLGMKDKNLKKI